MKIRKTMILAEVIVIVLLSTILLVMHRERQPVWEITQYRDESGNQGMFYTITSDKNHLIVIDGGWNENAGKVRNVIREKGGHVDAWILTHPHPDHIGAFNQIYANPEDIQIDRVYDNGLDYAYYDTLDQPWDEISVYANYLDLTRDDERVHHVSRDETMEFSNLNLCFYNTYDDIAVGYGNDICNDSSLVFKVSAGKKSMLFTGDCHSETVSRYLLGQYGNSLTADFVQMGHHGNNSLPKEFYQSIHAEKAFFDAPKWLLDGKNYTAKDTEAYMKGLGAEVFDYLSAPNTVVLS